jgi:hypothetical protein
MKGFASDSFISMHSRGCLVHCSSVEVLAVLQSPLSSFLFAFLSGAVIHHKQIQFRIFLPITARQPPNWNCRRDFVSTS